MNILGIILMSQPQDGEGSAFGTLLPMLLILVVFYFFMIRPQMKRQKDMRKFREAIKKGDKVITAGGIHGKVKNLSEGTIDVEIAENVSITVEKATVNPVNAPQDTRK